MQFQDYYSVLGVARNADEKEIRRAYREKARTYHPDVNKASDAEERFKAVNEAYQVLSDAEKRAKYDRFGADWERYQAAPENGRGASDFSQWFTGQRAPGQNVRYEYRSNGGEGFSDFFETLFGQSTPRGGRRRKSPRRGDDFEQTIDVPIREAFTGTTRTFEMQVVEPCQACGGTGIAQNDICDACDGAGSVPRRSRIEVDVPRGIRDGQRIRVAGKGSPGLDGGPPGDVYLRVRLRPDPTFTLDGNDLRVNIDMPLYTAVLGGEVIVPTMSGRVALTIPPETQNGRVFRLRRQGWPTSTGSDERGDLLARVNVVLPTKMSDEEHELFERLRSIRSGNRASATT